MVSRLDILSKYDHDVRASNDFFFSNRVEDMQQSSLPTEPLALSRNLFELFHHDYSLTLLGVRDIAFLCVGASD